MEEKNSVVTAQIGASLAEEVTCVVLVGVVFSGFWLVGFLHPESYLSAYLDSYTELCKYLSASKAS